MINLKSIFIFIFIITMFSVRADSLDYSINSTISVKFRKDTLIIYNITILENKGQDQLLYLYNENHKESLNQTCNKLKLNIPFVVLEQSHVFNNPVFHSHGEKIGFVILNKGEYLIVESKCQFIVESIDKMLYKSIKKKSSLVLNEFFFYGSKLFVENIIEYFSGPKAFPLTAKLIKRKIEIDHSNKKIITGSFELSTLGF